MIKHNLIQILEQLSENERKLLSLKLTDLLKENTLNSSSDKGKKLVAYIKNNDILDIDHLKTHTKGQLPDYMIPTSFWEVEKIPLLPNGKVDKNKLLKTKNNSLKADSNKSSILKPKTEIEEKLLKIWEEVLGFSPISTDDNFFEIGGDSILSIQIIAKARKNGTMLSPNQLFEHQTISELARVLLEVEKKQLEWDFVAKIRKEGSKKPLFCIHSGGGHVFFYGLLNKYLNAERPIYAIQPVGLYGSKELHKSVEEMTTEYLKAIREIQPEGPYNILVYCFSTSVGNEMAIQLDKIGEDINIIVVDTMASPWNINEIVPLKTRILSFLNRFLMNPLKSLRNFFKARKYIFYAVKGKYLNKGNEKQIEELKANLRKISLDYTWKENKGKVSLILTDRNEENARLVIKSWEKFAKGGVKTYYTKGNHTTLFEEPDIKYVSEQIDKCIID